MNGVDLPELTDSRPRSIASDGESEVLCWLAQPVITDFGSREFSHSVFSVSSVLAEFGGTRLSTCEFVPVGWIRSGGPHPTGTNPFCRSGCAGDRLGSVEHGGRGGGRKHGMLNLSSTAREITDIVSAARDILSVPQVTRTSRPKGVACGGV